MDNKHTPGPWAYSVREISDAINAGGPWAEYSVHVRGNSNSGVCTYEAYLGGEDEANVRLIAAAPDMHNELVHLRASHASLLAALEQILPYLQAGEALLARAAIAKATQE